LKHNYISTGFDGNKYISAILTESCRQVRGARKTDLEYIPELCTERHTGWLNIAGSINKLQRIGTRYSAGVLAESAIFTI
jgi:hypothetical protein